MKVEQIAPRGEYLDGRPHPPREQKLLDDRKVHRALVRITTASGHHKVGDVVVMELPNQ
jgi:hypothetical protein